MEPRNHTIVHYHYEEPNYEPTCQESINYISIWFDPIWIVKKSHDDDKRKEYSIFSLDNNTIVWYKNVISSTIWIYLIKLLVNFKQFFFKQCWNWILKKLKDRKRRWISITSQLQNKVVKYSYFNRILSLWTLHSLDSPPPPPTKNCWYFVFPRSTFGQRAKVWKQNKSS